MKLVNLFIAFLPSAFTFLNAQTPIGGAFLNDTTISVVGSPYEVTSNMLIAQGAKMTIEPGVVLMFDESIYFQIEGELRAAGTETDSITFMSHSTAALGWGGIRIVDNSLDYDTTNGTGTILKFCLIKGEGSFLTGPGGFYNSYSIRIERSAPLITKCEIKEFHSGVSHNNSSALFISNEIHDGGFFPLSVENYGSPSNNAYIYGNKIYNIGSIQGNDLSTTLWGPLVFRKNCIDNINFTLAIRVASNHVIIDSNSISNCKLAIGVFGGYDSTVQITNNIFSHNKKHLLFPACARDITIKGNNFLDYIDHNVYYDDYYFPFGNYDCPTISGSFYQMDLENNYWGGISVPQMNSSIWDFNDDFSAGVIADYSPVATSPFDLSQNPQCSSSPVELAETEHTEIITIYPNPNEGRFFVKAGSNTIDQILVFNIFGELVLDQKDQLNCDLSNHPKGIYFVVISSDHTTFTKKVIVY